MQAGNMDHYSQGTDRIMMTCCVLLCLIVTQKGKCFLWMQNFSLYVTVCL